MDESTTETPLAGPPPIQLVITLEPMTGQIRIDGNGIANKMLAYGMLEFARDAIHEYHQKAMESRIVAPFPGPMRVPRTQ